MLRKLIGLALLLIVAGIIALNFETIKEASEMALLRQESKRYIANKSWEKVINIYSDAWQSHPNNPEIGSQLAWAYHQNKQNFQAEKTYLQVISKFPQNLSARRGFASLLQETPERMNEAIDQLRVALKAEPKNVALLNQVGNLYRLRAELPDERRESVRDWVYEQAIYYYDESLKIEPKQFLTRFRLGSAHHTLHHWEPAAQAYCEALILEPDNYEARYNLGMVLTAMHFPDEGFRQLDRSVAILADTDRVKRAMRVAQQVQNIKNAFYESRDTPRRPFGGESTPPFLKKECLHLPAGIDDEKATTDEHK